MPIREPLLLGLTAILLVACGRRENPVEVVRSFMAAVETLDINKAQGLVCQAQRGKVKKSLTPFAGDELGETYEIKFDDLAFEETNNDGETATVRVTGKLILSFLGQQETQGVDEEHFLKKEKGRWLVCDP